MDDGGTTPASAREVPSRYLYGNAVADVQSAEGVTGCLCKGSGGRYFFRVYRAGGEFTDYDLRHDELEVTISPQAMASFYAIHEDRILDHSPAVLGLRPAEASDKTA